MYTKRTIVPLHLCTVVMCTASLWSSLGCHPAAPPQRARLRAQGLIAYLHKDWKTCAMLYEQAHSGYAAATCLAQAGDLDGAFAQLTQAIDHGQMADRDLAGDDDLALLHADPRWQPTLDHLAAWNAEHRKTLNAELIQLYTDDQADRASANPDWTQITPRDHARRERVDAILAAGGAHAADDYFHAAMVYQHGDAPDEIQRARDLALKAVALDPLLDSARWLAAAAEDRKLMYEHKPQKWGTQSHRVDDKWVLWPVDPAITDDQRAEWNVPPLHISEAQVTEMNAHE